MTNYYLDDCLVTTLSCSSRTLGSDWFAAGSSNTFRPIIYRNKKFILIPKFGSVDNNIESIFPKWMERRRKEIYVTFFLNPQIFYSWSVPLTWVENPERKAKWMNRKRMTDCRKQMAKGQIWWFILFTSFCYPSAILFLFFTYSSAILFRYFWNPILLILFLYLSFRHPFWVSDSGCIYLLFHVRPRYTNEGIDISDSRDVVRYEGP